MGGVKIFFKSQNGNLFFSEVTTNYTVFRFDKLSLSKKNRLFFLSVINDHSEPCFVLFYFIPYTLLIVILHIILWTNILEVSRR